VPQADLEPSGDALQGAIPVYTPTLGLIEGRRFQEPGSLTQGASRSKRLHELVVVKVTDKMDGLNQRGVQTTQEIKEGSGVEVVIAVSSHDFVAASSVHDPQQLGRALENPAALVKIPVTRPAQGYEVVLGQHLALPATTHASWDDVVPIQILSLVAYGARFHALFFPGCAGYWCCSKALTTPLLCLHYR